MKKWILAFRVDPPAHVVSARTGGSVFFAAYSRWLRQWYLVANGSEEIIDEPEMLFLDEEYASDHPSKIIMRPEKIRSCRKKKSEQLLLL